MLEYISAPEAAKNGGFLNGEFKDCAKKIEYMVLQSSAVCG